jgi:anaerobic magnesium-protoporphyrin IX monomethyl ester cyclase
VAVSDISEKKLKEFLLKGRDAISDTPLHMQSAKRTLRVVLIQPPNIDRVRSVAAPHFEQGSGIDSCKPPLGLLYVATTLKQRTPHIVYVIDAEAKRLSFEELAEMVAKLKPDVVGITAWTDLWYPSYRSGELIKKASPSAHLCYGGPHISIYPEESLAIPFVDSVIVGDGEIPFVYLCNQLSHGIEDNSFTGLHLKKGGVKPEPDTFYIHSDLDSLPIPDRTLLPLEDYNSALSNQHFTTTMITSRGCPHRCTFCKLNFQKTLSRSAENVLEEFRQIKALGIHEVEVYDDTFTWSHKRVETICTGLIQEKIDITWAVRDRVSKPSQRLLNLMYKAGCHRINYGIESGVQRVIDGMKKNITLQQARDAVRMAKEAQLQVLAFYMFGQLDESVEDMKVTIDFSLELDTDYAFYSLTIPYAGTEMYHEALRKNIITTDYWQAYAILPIPNFVPPQLINTHASLDELQEIQNLATRAFYLRTRQIIREILRVRNLKEFRNKLLLAIQIMKKIFFR